MKLRLRANMRRSLAIAVVSASLAGGVTLVNADSAWAGPKSGTVTAFFSEDPITVGDNVSVLVTAITDPNHQASNPNPPNTFNLAFNDKAFKFLGSSNTAKCTSRPASGDGGITTSLSCVESPTTSSSKSDRFFFAVPKTAPLGEAVFGAVVAYQKVNQGTTVKAKLVASNKGCPAGDITVRGFCVPLPFPTSPKAVLDSINKKLIVVGCTGAGNTALLPIALRYCLTHLSADKQKTLISGLVDEATRDGGLVGTFIREFLATFLDNEGSAS